MKIEIGADGKIIGTKRVSPNGQVSGLSEFAGMEVLVILPGKAETPQTNDIFFVEEMRKAIELQMQILFNQYKDIKKIYETPMEAARAYFSLFYPKSFQGLMENVNMWVKEQVNRNEEMVSKIDSNNINKKGEK